MRLNAGIDSIAYNKILGLESSRYLHRFHTMPKRSRETSPSSPLVPPSSTSDPSPLASSDAPSHSAKYTQTSPESPIRTVMKCSLPPHDLLNFCTFEDFEAHYKKVHAYRCSECRKNFPTEYFLGLHISENHDPLNEARRAKGEKTVCWQAPLHVSELNVHYSINAL